MKTKQRKKVEKGFSLFKMLTGLTFSEWWQLKKLKKLLTGGLPGSSVPDTAQRSITFEKMYRDGICKVRKGYYTKMVEFEDINYILQDNDAQAEILGLYSQFINYFEPGIHLQVFLFNRKVGEEELSKRYDIPLENNAFDSIRSEYSNVEKSQCEKGSNGVVKEFKLYSGDV